MIPYLDRPAAVAYVAKIAAVGLLLSSVELLAARDVLRDEGLLSWMVGRLRRPWLGAGWTGAVLDRLLRYPNIIGLIALRAAVAILIILMPAPWATSPLLTWPAAILCGLLVIRCSYGLDGADQMTWIIYISLAMASVVKTGGATTAALWFLALQSCLSYASAGFAKLIAKGWRDGSFLAPIVATEIYGHPRFARTLDAHPAAATVLARMLIAWECMFPVVLIAPMPIVMLILIGGVIFHLTTAYLMGLNTFLWAFIATYPAILYCVETRGW